MSSVAVAWRTRGLLFVGSGALGLLTLALGLGPPNDTALPAVLGLLAIVAGGAVLLAAEKLPERWLLAALLVCVVFVSVAVDATGGPGSPFLLFYAWVGMEAWYFLPRSRAIGFTAASALASGVPLIAVGGTADGALAWWAMVVGTMITLGVLTAALRARSDDLIDTLADRAARDSLTGLANRRGYQERIEQEIERARRHNLPLSIVLADIDDFKSLNDAFGHRRGDQALCEFAELCSRQLRATDFVSRVGGEEFAIVLPHLTEPEALVAAERLRRAIRAGLKAPDGRLLTASLGVASFPQHGCDPEVLLDHADQAMYAAKNLGRDRTVVFSEGLLESLRTHAPAEQLQAVLVLAEALDLRDSGTASHSQTVGRLCVDVARALGLPDERVERLRLAGILHDVGKLGVSDEILRKPGHLTEAEFAEMRKHAELGARMVAAAGMEDISSWVLAHHERPDGRGYPYGLQGREVPLEARILAVADAYEAMTSDRPYRRAPGHEHAVRELEHHAGTQFDREVTVAILRTFDLRTRSRSAEAGDEGAMQGPTGTIAVAQADRLAGGPRA
jgi:diguanylate cyclase (GGDEF)-like protein/putative nucleotidyltransferase with HDIG domain